MEREREEGVGTPLTHNAIVLPTVTYKIWSTVPSILLLLDYPYIYIASRTDVLERLHMRQPPFLNFTNRRVQCCNLRLQRDGELLRCE